MTTMIMWTFASDINMPFNRSPDGDYIILSSLKLFQFFLVGL